MQQVATGGLRDYAITAPSKLPEFPNAESLSKTLGPKLDVVYWQAIFAPELAQDFEVQGELRTAPLPRTLPDLERQALAARPDLLSAETAVAKAEADVRLANLAGFTMWGRASRIGSGMASSL